MAERFVVIDNQSDYSEKIQFLREWRNQIVEVLDEILNLIFFPSFDESNQEYLI